MATPEERAAAGETTPPASVPAPSEPPAPAPPPGTAPETPPPTLPPLPAPAPEPLPPVTPPAPPAEPSPPTPTTPAEPAAPAPTFGGATPDPSVEAATAAKDKNDPGFVVAKPLLTTGAFGHDVAELAKLLDAAGHPNAVAAGLEPPMLTDELMRLVRAFQLANGIDPAKPQHGVAGGDTSGPAGAPLVRADHEGIVEWSTWAALYNAAGVPVELGVSERYPEGSFA